jgi:pyruvate formate lyase activating enzyme
LGDAITGLIFDVKRFALHDGPGIRTSVFLKGCPLRCVWCHNPEGRSPYPELALRPTRCLGCAACVEVCPRGAVVEHNGRFLVRRDRCEACGRCAEVCYSGARERVGRRVSPEELLAELEKDRDFYAQSGGGVTFTGGEPFFQARFLNEMLRLAKARSLHTAVDTCGYADWDDIERCLPWTDLFLFDLKVMDEKKHRRFTGVGNGQILHNLRLLVSRGARVQVRIPVVPGANDDPENWRATAAFLTSLPEVPPVELLPYHRLGESKFERLDREPEFHADVERSRERARWAAELLRRAGLVVAVGG